MAVNSRNIEDMEDAVEAAAVASVLFPNIRNQINDLVRVAISEYRTGHMDPVRALCLIAEISSIQHLHDNLEYRVRKGELAAEREYAGR